MLSSRKLTIQFILIHRSINQGPLKFTIYTNKIIFLAALNIMQMKKEVLITDIDAKNMVPLFSADNEHFDSVLSTSSQQEAIGVNVKIIFSPIEFQVFKTL